MPAEPQTLQSGVFFAEKAPVRIIDVGHRDQHPRLCVPAKDGETSRYLALSYCWELEMQLLEPRDLISMLEDANWIMRNYPKPFETSSL